jgi:predicted ribosomally synthesized peptide with SipW-like signal peptide
MGKTRRSLIILTLGILVGVMAFGVVGSAAWFTDQDGIDDSSIGAGVLSIDVRSEEGVSQPFTIENLAPGGDWDGPYPFGVYNDGTLNALYDIGVADIVQSVGGFKNKVNVKLIPYFGGAFDDTCTGSAAYLGTLAGLSATTSDHVYGDPLLVNWTHPWKICFALDSSAGNGYQGATATFDIVVDAYQPESVAP